MMIDKVRAALKKEGILHSGRCITVALSGGADSTALLHSLRLIASSLSAEENPFSLSAAHLHHGIRGAEADRDEAFVRQLCARWDIPLQVGHADIPALCRETGEGMEECARRVRYEFLTECAGDGLIATAHTASDHAETVLMHLLRGSALRGLCGIPCRRGNILRPLLSCTREEIEAHCREHRLDFVTDSTNLTDDSLRNRIRHHLMPLLEQLEPGFSHRVGTMTHRLEQDDAYLSSVAEETYQALLTDGALPCKPLSSLAPAIRSRVLMRWAGTVSPGRLESRHIAALEALVEQGGTTTLPGNIQVLCDDRCLAVKPLLEEIPFSMEPIPAELGTLRLPMGRYRLSEWTRAQAEQEKIYNLLLNESLDCDRIQGNLYLRTRLPGDHITLPGRPRKSLKKLLNEAHLPLHRRQALLVAADDTGLVFLEGFGADIRCRPTQTTSRFLRIETLEEPHA